MSDSPALVERSARIRRVLESVTGVPVTDGNHITVLRNGDQIFPCMLEAIEQAERTVDLLTFVYWSGEIGERFAAALAERARSGVRVRVLLDAVGAKPMDPELIARMTDAGCDVRRFRPPDPLHPLRSGHRTHRKILVCDERIGFTGGVGIADEWLGDGRQPGHWRETHMRVEGRAVDGLRAAFLDNWTETDLALFDTEYDHWPTLAEDGPCAVQVVQGSAEPGWNAVSTTVRALMDLAEERLRVTTAYFVPDDDLMNRFRLATERGVEVQVLVPGPEADKRFVQVASEACYTELLALGIEVHCYQPSMLHAKVLTVDGAVATVGSANFNNRSRSLDEEVNLVVYDADIVAELDRDFDDDLRYSRALDLSRWKDRSRVQRGLERVIRIAEPWM